ncbi:hypothetical protein CEQ90_08095 [Lewinellaceae bacterium SD302]|nr:hypothetical protein CEQ90_08095 [Lewinellaceae bacterium SD302]
MSSFSPSCLLSIFLLVFLGLTTPLFAQTPYGSPKANEKMLGLEDVNLIDQMMVYIPGVGSPSREALERQNIKAYMMPIRQCSDLNLEWAYALTSGVEYYVNLNNNYKDNLSPDYLALSLAGQGTRPNLIDGFKFLVENGTVSASIVPFGSQTIPRAVFNVPRFTITNYAYLFRPTTRERNRIFELRKALSRGNPVIVELSTAADFSTLKSPIYQINQPPTETHYLTIVGYDESEKTFELRSSFGRHWADAGYVRISYDDLARYANNGYVIIPKQ